MRCLTLLLCAAAAACSSDEPVPEPTPPGALFTADEPAAGARLWLEAEKNGAAVTVSLWGADLGPVFGWSAHVGFDAAALQAGAASIDEAVLADGVHVAMPRQGLGDVAFGGTRRSPEAGDVAIDEATRLAAIDLTPSSSTPTRLELGRALVRTGDGSYTPVTTSGGLLDPGGAP